MSIEEPQLQPVWKRHPFVALILLHTIGRFLPWSYFMQSERPK